jgi:hypothetical protein
MVDHHSVAASSQPSRRERESERETTSRSRAGRSRRSRGHTDITTIMLESQPTAGTTTSPAAAGLDAALLAACQLLNNPPSAGASPSAAKQWRHDVDQLVITAINTPHHEGAAPAICVAVAVSVSDAYVVRGAGALGAARCAPTSAAPRADG